MTFPLDLDVEVPRDDVVSGALDIVKAVKPDWDPDEIQHQEFTAGISNRLYGFFVEKGGDKVLVRIYGENTERFIDRHGENEYIKILHENGCAAKLYARFKNGISYGFLPGKTLDTTSVRNPDIVPLVCDRMAKIHCIELHHGENGDTHLKSCLWERFDQLLELMPAKFANEGKDERYKNVFPPVDDLRRRVDELKELLCPPDSFPIVLCHNDVLLENIVLDRSRSPAQVHFIDYEYVGLNWPAYDIANHFNEWAGVETVDYSLFPEEEEQKAWIRQYLMKVKGHKKYKCITVTDREVDEMYEWVNKFVPASHLMWAVWGVVQAAHSTLDFDHLEYGSIRYREYERQLAKNFPSI